MRVAWLWANDRVAGCVGIGPVGFCGRCMFVFSTAREMAASGGAEELHVVNGLN